jgi:hypothetical protein
MFFSAALEAKSAVLPDEGALTSLLTALGKRMKKSGQQNGDRRVCIQMKAEFKQRFITNPELEQKRPNGNRIQPTMTSCARTVRTHRKAVMRIATAVFCLLMAPCIGHASTALLMEEPYGAFGAMNPTGHAAVYLNHVCADSPTVLRPCHDGEYGVVISRYHKIDGYDWIAIPLVPYLYAVDSVSDIPATVDKAQEAAVRDAYRRAHLLDLAPDGKTGGPPKGEWTELVGASYDRKIHGFQVDSTPEQDAEFIALFNDRRNVGHFNLLFHNCADFSRVVLDTYMPHAVHRNFIADAGLMTPKQVARSLVAYGKKHPETNMKAFVIPQVPGSVPRSHSVDGVAESLIKSKKYLIPLAVFAPEVTGGVVVAYLVDGRLKMPKDATLFDIGDEENSGSPPPEAEPVRERLTLRPAVADPSPSATAAPPT